MQRRQQRRGGGVIGNYSPVLGSKTYKLPVHSEEVVQAVWALRGDGYDAKGAGEEVIVVVSRDQTKEQADRLHAKLAATGLAYSLHRPIQHLDFDNPGSVSPLASYEVATFNRPGKKTRLSSTPGHPPYNPADPPRWDTRLRLTALDPPLPD